LGLAPRLRGRGTVRLCSPSPSAGHVTGPVIGVGDFAAVGRFTFDAKGSLTGKVLFRVNGSNGETPEFTGTYSVSPDCIVTNDQGGGNVDVSVLVDDGKGYFISTHQTTEP